MAKLSEPTLHMSTVTCIVCYDRRPEVALVPCGHQNLCSVCARRWHEEGEGKCPTDRIQVSHILPLEIHLD